MYVPSVYVCDTGVYFVSLVLVWCRLQTRLLNQSRRGHQLKTRNRARTLVIWPFCCFHINHILFSLSIKYFKILIPEGSARLSAGIKFEFKIFLFSSCPVEFLSQC